MKEETMQVPIKMKRTAYICAELDEAPVWKNVARRVSDVVEEFRGEVTESGYLFENFTIKAVFPHRRFKALEEAVRTALAGLPVRDVVVWPTDPFKLRRNRAA
ncbi:MAG TPA: hypothetical protein VGK29_22705 [Paludibaculum sp.]|jgi:hypothetical protein